MFIILTRHLIEGLGELLILRMARPGIRKEGITMSRLDL